MTVRSILLKTMNVKITSYWALNGEDVAYFEREMKIWRGSGTEVTHHPPPPSTLSRSGQAPGQELLLAQEVSATTCSPVHPSG